MQSLTFIFFQFEREKKMMNKEMMEYFNFSFQKWLGHYTEILFWLKKEKIQTCSVHDLKLNSERKRK